MGALDRKFGNRQRKLEGDGHDFEAFVFECLALAGEDKGLKRRLAKGRDGAIDLIDSNPGTAQTHIAECKFVGDGEFKSVRARWRDVADNLDRNLPGLHSDPKKKPHSPYRLWLDASCPVTQYSFCVSCPLSKQDEKALQSEIQAFFGTLYGRGISGLAALALPTGISVKTWDHFDRALKEKPALAFRWFGGLPAGFSLFEAEREKADSFRGFLRGATLPYFSRSRFAQTDAAIDIDSEDIFVARLGGLEETSTLLIAGPGGAGKTRLAYEIAEGIKERENDATQVFKLDRDATAGSLEELLKAFITPATIVLLIDYAEAQSALEQIARRLPILAGQTQHRFRLIATCRSSAQGQVEDALADLSPHVVDMASRRKDEPAFAAWVTRQILEFGKIPDARAMEKLCTGMPALASFAVFLFQHHRERFADQFGALTGLQDFQAWARRRLSILLQRHPATANGLSTLSELALSLPMSRSKRDALVDGGGETAAFLTELETDRWIEFDGDYLFPSHDILADAITARWLLESSANATSRTADALRKAAQSDDLRTAWIALDRLAPHPLFRDIDGAQVVNRITKLGTDKLLPVFDLILGGQLLRLGEKIDALAKFDDMRTFVARERSLDIALSSIAEQAADLPEDKKASHQLDLLAEPLDAAVHYARPSNIVTRRAYALFPARYREAALRRIYQSPTSSDTHYLIAEMLRREGDWQGLQSATLIWLQARSANDTKASFVIGAWLYAGGDKSSVREPIRAWCKEYAETPEARFVYQAWLDAGGDPELVREPIQAWLKERAETPEVQFIYKAWLDANGHQDVVLEPIRAWLKKHAETPEARFVYKAWLDASGHCSVVLEPIRAWLGRYGTIPEAAFVYEAWLSAGGNHAVITDFLSPWIAQNTQLETADFVYRAWIENGGDIEDIRDAVFAWLHHWKQDARAVYVTKEMSKLHDLPEEVIVDIAEWAARFVDNDDALYRIGRIARFLTSNRAKSEIVQNAVIKSGLRNLQYFNISKKETARSRTFAAASLIEYLSVAINTRYFRYCLISAIARAISNNYIYREENTEIKLNPRQNVVGAVYMALKYGYFDKEKDADALYSFAGWLNAQMPAGNGGHEINSILESFFGTSPPNM